VIGLFVRFDIEDEESARRFDELTATVVTRIDAEEPGTLVYATHVVRDAPLSRVFYELYADEDAFRAHEQASHVIEFHRQKGPLLAGEPRVEFFTPAAAIGLRGPEAN
jgi:quinol monooxygenase YgiN